MVSNDSSDFGDLIIKAPKDDFSMPSIKAKVTLTWDKGYAVRVFDGESEVKAAKAGKTGDIRKGKSLFIE